MRSSLKTDWMRKNNYVNVNSLFIYRFVNDRSRGKQINCNYMIVLLRSDKTPKVSVKFSNLYTITMINTVT